MAKAQHRSNMRRTRDYVTWEAHHARRYGIEDQLISEEAAAAVTKEAHEKVVTREAAENIRAVEYGTGERAGGGDGKAGGLRKAATNAVHAIGRRKARVVP